MALNTTTLISKITTHAKKIGKAKSVITHDPISAPPFGTISVVVREVRCINFMSGLNKTAVLIVFSIAMYANDEQEPKDGVETNLMGVMDLLLNSFHADLTLGGACTTIDVLGMNGTALGAAMGRVTIDKSMYRVLDIALPVIIADVWTQGG